MEKMGVEVPSEVVQRNFGETGFIHMVEVGKAKRDSPQADKESQKQEDNENFIQGQPSVWPLRHTGYIL